MWRLLQWIYMQNPWNNYLLFGCSDRKSFDGECVDHKKWKKQPKILNSQRLMVENNLREKLKSNLKLIY